jgi:hypothetical protein
MEYHEVEEQWPEVILLLVGEEEELRVIQHRDHEGIPQAGFRFKSASNWYGSADPDQHSNVTYSQHWINC